MITISDYDVILVNSSAGKDSQAMLHYVYQLAAQANCTDRIVVVHADLGRVEWKGTRELAEAQAAHYGVRFEVVTYIGKNGPTLLDYVRKRGKWPSSKMRYCTSDLKRGPVGPLITRLAREVGPGAKILNCLGFRAEESPARAKRIPFEIDVQKSSRQRTVWTWYPIFDWNAQDVWNCIKASGVAHHPAYDLGMPRLSCCFCIFAPKDALVIAGRANPELLDEYVALETEIGHDFKHKQPIAKIKALIESGYQPANVQSWSM